MRPRPTQPVDTDSLPASIGDNSAGSSTPDLVIEYLPTDAVRPDPRSPRSHSPRQITQIAQSERTFGFNVPLIVDEDGQLICGHGRWLAAKKLKLARVPVIRIRHLSPAQVRAFQIADNKLTENSTWDRKLLAETFRDLAVLDLEFDLSVTGFEMAEIDLTLKVLDEGDEADDVPVAPGPAVTRPGDLWEILGHRIVCGDALQEGSYRALFAEELAAMMFTDPPYNVPIQGNAAGFGKVKYEEFAQACGEMSEPEFIAFQVAAYLLTARFVSEGALAYIFMDWRHLYEVMVAARRAFVEQRNLCVWDKGVGGQGSFYRSQHELVSVWLAKAGKPRNNIQLGRFGRTRTNIWPYPSPSRLGVAGEEGRLTLDHPTPKPVALVADAILDCTARGEIVLDPFLGGGATLLAAERTGRRCFGIEIEPRFVDAAIRRLRRACGEDARRLSDGRLFSDLEREALDGE